MAYYSRHTGEEIDSLLEQISEGVIVEVDSSLSSTSKNPVQNKVVTSALANKQEKLISGTTIKTINSIPILGAGNIVISGGGSNSGVSYEEVEQMLQGKQDSISDLADIREGASLGATAIQREDLASVATSGSYNDLKNKPTIPVAVTESTVSGWGFTKNTGTYTKPSGGIPKDDMASGVQASLNRADTALQSYTEIYRGTITGVKMNGVVKGTSGQVDLGTVITEHQDISGKQDVIADLDSIRKKANSAIQSIPDEYVTSDELESTISSKGFATESWVEGKGYLTEHQDISKKQDVILDLAAIRAGAAKGATALQEVPDTYVTDDELASSLGGKQDKLVSGVNLKTINGTSLLGGGNVVIAGEGGISYDDTELRYLISNKVDKVEGKELSTNDFTDEDKAKLDSLENYDDTSVISLIRNKQDKLVSGSNIRTINGTSILGGGDIEIEGDSYDDTAIKERISDVESSLEEKQDVISDLDVIRDGASKGATALQSVPSEYMTEEEVGAEMAKKANTDGVYPDMTVGRSANLLGVADGESAEFLFRPTDGDGSIKDGFASIESIKGNSLVWNQLAKKRTTTTSAAGLTAEWEGDYIRVTGTYTKEGDTNIYDSIESLQNVVQGQSFAVLSDNSKIGLYVFGVISGTLATSAIVKTNASGKMDITMRPMTALEAGTTVNEIIRPKIINLTKMFGAGNEPTTIEEFYARIPMGVDINAYNEGEVINMCADSIKTVGFNAWDEEWELGNIHPETGNLVSSSSWIRSVNPTRVIGGMEYFVNKNTPTSVTLHVLFYDSAMNYLSYVDIFVSKSFVTPQEAAYIKIAQLSTTYNHDFCINLVHTGYRNGEYEPYVSNEKALPIADYFPNGMNAIGDVKDELTPAEAIQRIGVVDMGTLNWYYESNIKRFVSSILPKSAKQYGIIGNTLSAYGYYDSTAPIAPKEENLALSVYLNKIYLFNTAYTDATSFKAAMSGVMLYYELAEPIVTKIDTPLELTYPAWDFGTEEIIANTPTTPFRGSIIYEFNARDTIRANKRAVNELREDVEANKIGLLGKQDTLISSTNIKTINGESILGEGDLAIEQGETLTEDDIAAMGFTKNTGTYSKPTTGIPKTDLASDVQTSLGKADTALQSENDPIFSASPAASITTERMQEWDNKAGKVVNHESSDTNVELTPYVTHKWGAISSLTLTFSESSESEYNVVFEANDADFVLAIPQNIRWANSQIPQFEANKQYEINIKGERALYAVFDAPYIEET